MLVLLGKTEGRLGGKKGSNEGATLGVFSLKKRFPWKDFCVRGAD